MNWVQLWAKIHVIEKFISLGVLILIILFIGTIALIIYVGDWLDNRKRKRKKNN